MEMIGGKGDGRGAGEQRNKREAEDLAPSPKRMRAASGVSPPLLIQGNSLGSRMLASH
jgi:hypothetical protein